MRASLILLLFLGAMCCHAAAQPADTPQRADGIRPNDAMLAARLVDRAVRIADASLIADNEAREWGAEVVIRHEGLILGSGTSAGGESPLRDATREAIEDAYARITPDNDLLAARRAAPIIKALVVEVTLMDEMIPSSDDTFAAFGLSINPGKEGVAVRLGERTHAASPRTLRESKKDPLLVCRSFVSAHAGEPEAGLLALGALRDAGFAIGRVPAIEIRIAGEGADPRILARGSVNPPTRRLSGADLRKMHRGLARALASRVLDSPVDGLAVGLVRANGISEPADATQTALLALALARAASSGAMGMEERRLCAEALGTLLKSAAADGLEDRPALPQSVGLASMWVCVHASMADGGLRPPDEQTRQFLGSCSLAVWTEVRAAERLDDPVRSLVVCAAALDARRLNDAGMLEEARSAERRLRRGLQVPSLIGEEPWLSWAQRAIAGERGERPGAADTREMLAMVSQNQILDADVRPGDGDFVGGVVFTAAASPLPSWITARGVVPGAIALGDPLIVGDEERAGSLQDLLRSIRFLHGLVVDSDDAAIYAVSPLSVGALQASPWDSDLPVEASITAFFAVDETLLSLERIASRRERP